MSLHRSLCRVVGLLGVAVGCRLGFRGMPGTMRGDCERESVHRTEAGAGEQVSADYTDTRIKPHCVQTISDCAAAGGMRS